MGKQLNKAIKRARRTRYNKRVKTLAKAKKATKTKKA
jgi:hypothetical protein